MTSDRLVLLHGFTQTAASWDGLTALLREALHPCPTIVALDAPGHGTHGDERADLPAGAIRLGEEGGRATYVGYSMGGRFALHLALARPDLVEALVLIGATPGIEDDAERTARLRADEALAAHLERIGLDAFLREWLAQPIFATLPRDAHQLDVRRRNTVAGLASSLRLAGTGAQEPLWERLPELGMPVLVLAGDLDHKFADIGRRMVDRLARGELVLVPGAGHSAHLEQPAATVAAVASWWERQPPSANPSANAAP